jgi:prophage antirepressor-like protein
VTDLMNFQYDSLTVRTLVIDGEPWIVGVDVCRALGLVNPRDALGRLDPDGVGTADVIDSIGRTQNAKVINEAGLYELIFQSRTPGAAQFRRWVTHEVLPSIRRTGSYIATPEEDDTTLIARALQASARMLEQKDAKIAELVPRAVAWDELASGVGDYEVADAAKMLSRAGIPIGSQRLFRQLNDLGWIYRGSGGKWKARQAQVDAGYLAERPMSHHHPRTGEVVVDPPQVRVTLKGLERLRVRLGDLTTSRLSTAV